MGKRLVAYFSASGTTRKIAEIIAQVAEADLYEIMPKQPYSKADLNWMDKKSRSSVEMSDKKFRPEISNPDAQVEKYDEIILGFPIWCKRQVLFHKFWQLIFHKKRQLIFHTYLDLYTHGRICELYYCAPCGARF